MVLNTCGSCGRPGHNKRSCGRAPAPRDAGRRNPADAKANALWKFYRLGHAEYLAMVAEGCRICVRDLGGRTPDVDHDHGCSHPGKGLSCCRGCVRGVLCRSCNLRVGAFERGCNHDSDVAEYLGRGLPVLAAAQGSLFD